MSFAAISGEGFLIPKDFGILTRSCSTGCWRGYITEYEIRNNEIYLNEFLFRPDEDAILPEINGIEPIKFPNEEAGFDVNIEGFASTQ